MVRQTSCTDGNGFGVVLTEGAPRAAHKGAEKGSCPISVFVPHPGRFIGVELRQEWTQRFFFLWTSSHCAHSHNSRVKKNKNVLDRCKVHDFRHIAERVFVWQVFCSSLCQDVEMYTFTTFRYGCAVTWLTSNKRV